MILLNWFFQDETSVEAILRNVSDIISRRDDHYVALGWCILARSLIEYENVVSDITTNGNFVIYVCASVFLCTLFYSTFCVMSVYVTYVCFPFSHFYVPCDFKQCQMPHLCSSNNSPSTRSW